MTRPTLHEICQVLKINDALDCHTPISGVAFDSREVQPGQLFVALKGLRVDGHDFVQQAFDRGALAALVSDHFCQNFKNIIKVKDPLLALQQIARWHVARSSAQVIAITGSLGKTSAKDFLYTLLKSGFKTACTTGNQNSQIGMAVSLLNNVQGDEEFVVVEMGMTKSGHIEQLVSIIPPDKALVTSIALVHAENFEAIEGIARAKAEVFSSPKTTLALLNKDSECVDLLQNLAHCKTLTYSQIDPEADFFLKVTQDGLVFSIQGVANNLPYISLPAPHVYLNLLAACSMAFSCGMSPQKIGLAFSSIKLPEKRLEVVSKAGICFVDDSYNAAEQSMKAALSYMKSYPGQSRKIAVIGQMRELGRFSEECHKAVGEHALECVDKIFCLGEECAPIVSVCKEADRECLWFTDFVELVAALKNELRENDLVLLKGSRSNGLWRVLEHFN